MSILVAILLPICSLFAFIAGKKIPLNHAKLTSSTAAVCSLLILINMLIRLRPDFEYQYLDYDIYSYIRQWWIFPFIIYLFSLGQRISKSSIARNGAFILLTLIIVFISISIYFTFNNNYQFLGTPDKNGYCPQTTGISCGAAAAATFLSIQGCHTTEAEIANISNTNPITGTSEFAVLRAIRNKLPKPTGSYLIRNLNFNQLTNYQKPIMTVIKLNQLINHWITITEVTSEKIKIIDPLIGPRSIPKQKFLNIWRNASIFYSK